MQRYVLVDYAPVHLSIAYAYPLTVMYIVHNDRAGRHKHKQFSCGQQHDPHEHIVALRWSFLLCNIIFIMQMVIFIMQPLFEMLHNLRSVIHKKNWLH